MELILYGILTTLFWAVSATIFPLFILRNYSKTVRDVWFPHLFLVWFKPIIEFQVLPLRKKTFQLLENKLSGRDVTKPLKVLEIGVASGRNLEFYPENSHLTALDVTAHFLPFLKRNQKKFPHVFYERTVISPAENMKDIDHCSMDLVISTYVLCSVTSIDDALKEIKRVLKPGGTFLFLEHVGFPNSEWGYIIQKFVSPLWYRYMDGCCLTRNIGDAIQNSGFSDVFCKRIYPRSVCLYSRPHDYGFATK